ncbi:flagellar biosynthetic protein FliO [Virgibacillus doumboii]|uniref:flagellar biosynthetic protein FliO n=1 Tax=Virgibacillus doumboii TaxID=2697503 RepID=UPI001FE905EB|nr:flagellar biosynthetic protein FliO [Virgibacillus doumboii]
MIRRNILGICLTALIITTCSFTVVQAASTNVKDCLEGNADCFDTNGTPANETEDGNSESTGGESGGSLLFTLIKMVFALLLVLGLIYLLLKFLKNRNKLFNQVQALENLGGISVGPNKSVQLVRIGSKVYVIGVGENVEMLQEIKDEEVKREILHNNDSNEIQQASLLTSLFQKNTDTDEKNQSKKDFKNMFSTELEKLKQSRSKLINQRKNKEDKHE